jgi:single-strand DNA-binding protein
MLGHGGKAMTQQQTEAAPGQNSVSLRGRVSSAPLERELPSGDTILTFRLVLARDKSPMTNKSKQSSDWVDCVAWGGRVRRSVSTWRVGDVVELEGALRRRFFRTDGRTSTRVEVEVLAGRMIERSVA